MIRQFGHNDQKAAANISLSEYQKNLENLATEVKEAGGTPVRRLDTHPTQCSRADPLKHPPSTPLSSDSS